MYLYLIVVFNLAKIITSMIQMLTKMHN
jgi:hypothetical protein